MGIGPLYTAVPEPLVLKVSPDPLKLVGDPDCLVKITAVCHFSTMRDRTPWVLPRSF